MVKIANFLKLVNPKRGYYSHEDQEVHGLRFRVWHSDSAIALYGIKGEESEIANYTARFGADISELNDTDMKTEIDKYRPRGERPCDFCGGTGKIIVPAFDSAKAKRELDDVSVPSSARSSRQ